MNVLFGKPRKTSRRKEEGFTLTEIMVVVFIIGLLSTVILVNVFGASTDAQLKTARANVSALTQSLERYRLAMYSYPTESQGLDALVDAPAGLDNPALYPQGGFIQQLPSDPWGRNYQYVIPAERSRFAYDVFSLGADGQPGGEGENADIGNWDQS
ncbi:MAG: type II secretion system major pseudopilin GspG [Pseudomonadota bacterium]